MKPEINLPRVYSGKISLGKTLFPRGKVRSVTTANTSDLVVIDWPFRLNKAFYLFIQKEMIFILKEKAQTARKASQTLRTFRCHLSPHVR